MRQEDCSTLWDPQQKMLDGRMWSVCNVGPQVCSVEPRRRCRDTIDWDDMVQQIVLCTAVQTPMNSDYPLERNSVTNDPYPQQHGEQ